MSSSTQDDNLLFLFKGISITFVLSAIFTGLHALIYPVHFSRDFGLPINKVVDDPGLSISTIHGTSYVSLMGVRQLATGLILLVFAYQKKWIEMAVVLSVIGVLVAGTDALFLAQAGKRGKARYHAIPGLLIAMLAAAVWIRST